MQVPLRQGLCVTSQTYSRIGCDQETLSINLGFRCPVTGSFSPLRPLGQWFRGSLSEKTAHLRWLNSLPAISGAPLRSATRVPSQGLPKARARPPGERRLPVRTRRPRRGASSPLRALRTPASPSPSPSPGSRGRAPRGREPHAPDPPRDRAAACLLPGAA